MITQNPPAKHPYFLLLLKKNRSDAQMLPLCLQSLCHWLVNSYMLLHPVHWKSCQHKDGSNRLESKERSLLFLSMFHIFLKSHSDISLWRCRCVVLLLHVPGLLLASPLGVPRFASMAVQLSLVKTTDVAELPPGVKCSKGLTVWTLAPGCLLTFPKCK